jgi:hypothetical protein
MIGQVLKYEEAFLSQMLMVGSMSAGTPTTAEPVSIKPLLRNFGKPLGRKSFVFTMAAVIKAHLSRKVSNSKHSGMNGSNSSFGIA